MFLSPHHSGNYNNFRSFLPGAADKTKYVFLIISVHRDRTVTNSFGAIRSLNVGKNNLN